MVRPHEITHILATGDVADSINLTWLGNQLGWEGVKYNPDRFPGLLYYIRNPRTCFTIFDSGAVLISALKTEADINTAFDLLVDDLDNLGVTIVGPTGPEMRNFSGLKDYETTFDLEQVAICLSNCEWEPDRWSGAIQRAYVGSDRIALLIFENGKVVSVGANSSVNLEQGYTDLTADLTTCGLL